ncbi:MAG: hypothetical protein N3J91_11610 [Verrucomicrobiae bacterium]|nr:hypothetical protein [Verrucomicrobiae bacterium]
MMRLAISFLSQGRRLAALLLGVGCLGQPGLWAAEGLPGPFVTNQAAATLEELAKLDPRLARELEQLKIRRWDLSVNVALGAGYKDNVLLSHERREASPFVRVGAEATLVRLPQKGWSFAGLASWEDLRFTRHVAVGQEQAGMAVGELKKAWGEAGHVALRGQYMYLDQVLDLSDEQGIGQPLPVRLHALQPRLIAHRELGRNFFAEVEAGGGRYEYEAPVDDYWEGGPLGRVGYRYGRRSELSLAYDYNNRGYDSRQVTDAAGVAQGGRRLEFAQHRTVLNWRHHLDEERRWRVGMRVRVERSVDNGADYYGYWKYGLQPQVRYQQARWNAQAALRWMYYHYPVQTLAPGSGERYERSELEVSLRGELKLTRETRLEWEYQWEGNYSNLKYTEYQAHTVWAGVAWEF